MGGKEVVGFRAITEQELRSLGFSAVEKMGNCFCLSIDGDIDGLASFLSGTGWEYHYGRSWSLEIGYMQWITVMPPVREKI